MEQMLCGIKNSIKWLHEGKINPGNISMGTNCIRNMLQSIKKYSTVALLR